MNPPILPPVSYTHLDVYKRQEITSTNGASSVVINNGDMGNKGWELSLTSTPVHTELVTWGLSFNTSKNYNKISKAQELALTYENYLDGTITVSYTHLDVYKRQVTYCVKGIVKQALREVGFSLKRLPGPPGKREMLRAGKGF